MFINNNFLDNGNTFASANDHQDGISPSCTCCPLHKNGKIAVILFYYFF